MLGVGEQPACDPAVPIVRMHHEIRDVGDCDTVGKRSIIGKPFDRQGADEVPIAFGNPNVAPTLGHRAKLLSDGVGRPTARPTHGNDCVLLFGKSGPKAHADWQSFRPIGVAAETAAGRSNLCHVGKDFPREAYKVSGVVTTRSHAEQCWRFKNSVR
jgi:hypothetical protein